VDFIAWAWIKSSPKLVGNQVSPIFCSATSYLPSFSLRRGLRLPPHSPPTWPPSSPPTQLLTSSRVATTTSSLSFLKFRLKPPVHPPTSSQASDNNFIPSTRSPSIFLSHRLQLLGCMQNVNYYCSHSAK